MSPSHIEFQRLQCSHWLNCFCTANGKEMLIDIDSKTKDEILEHLIKVVGKSADVLAAEAMVADKKDNPANFGIGCAHGCMCDIPGQLPCPGIVPLPNHMRGKFRHATD